MPSFRLYTQRDIAKAIPGEGNHTFNRDFAEADESAAPAQSDSELGERGPVSPSQDEPQRALAEQFCRIMVHDKAHAEQY